MPQEQLSPSVPPPHFPRWLGVLCRTLLLLLLLGVCVQCTPRQQSGQTQGQPQVGRDLTQSTAPSGDTTKNTEVAAPASPSSPEELLERFNLSVDRG